MSNDLFVHVTYAVEVFADGHVRSRCGPTLGDESDFAGGWKCVAAGLTIDKGDRALEVDTPLGKQSPVWNCEATKYDSRGGPSRTTLEDIVRLQL